MDFVKCFFGSTASFPLGHDAGGTMDGTNSKVLPDPPARNEQIPLLCEPNGKAVASVGRGPTAAIRPSSEVQLSEAPGGRGVSASL